MIHWSTFVVNFIVPRSWQKLWQPLPLYVVSHYTVFIYIYVSTIDVNHSYLKIDNCDNWHFWIADDESNHSASGEKKKEEAAETEEYPEEVEEGDSEADDNADQVDEVKKFCLLFCF